MPTKLINKKICLLGVFGVGKTSLINRFVHDRFDDNYISTIGVKVSQKIQSPIENKRGRLSQFNFIIWDIEGFEDEYTPNNNFFIGAAGALVVADLTRAESIDRIPSIIDIFRKASPHAEIVLLGNKSDLQAGGMREKTAEPFETIAKNENLRIIFTSAKTGDNVEYSFEQLGRLLAEKL
jgi:small GTP-binding protein